jgi:hypothetical protein
MQKPPTKDPTAAPSPTAEQAKPEPLAQGHKASGSTETDIPEPKPEAVQVGLPLIEKLHESVEGMVTAARIAGKMDRLEVVLQSLIAHADKWKITFEQTLAV